MKRSALHHHHQKAGALWTQLDGWELPASFGAVEQEVAQAREGVGVADISYFRKFESAAPQTGSWKLASNRHLVMRERPVAPPDGTLDITSVYAALLLAGPQTNELLRKLTSLNLSHFANGNCAQASLAHAHAILIREDLDRLLSYKVLVTRDYAESVWESILHAGREFHIAPFGLNALDRLRP